MTISQTDEVLQILAAGHVLTARDAMVKHGIGRLAARVHELRQAGYQIAGKWQTKRSTRDGTVRRFIAYSAPAEGMR